jgi:sulfotransferase family protein
MLVWVASYPRSGNTFVRMLLQSGFGLPSLSWHGSADPGAFGSLDIERLVGHRDTAVPQDALIAWAQAQPDVCMIKTHEPPATNDPAIYVVRDGRSCVVSYHRYLNDIEHLPASLQDVIEGRVFAGSWSEHFAAWQPTRRPNTLLLRYEEITARPEEAVARLGDFLHRQPLGGRIPEFEELRRLNPHFFRAGDDAANIQQLQPYDESFRSRHTEVMTSLGYL